MIQKKVSIIVSVCKQDKNLEKTIEAILNQTWKNLEIIIVDSGSTEKPFDILEEERKKDQRINYIRKVNSDVFDPAVEGIEASNGDFICFVNPQDCIGSDFIENFMLEIKDYDFIAMGFYERNEKGIFSHYLKETRAFTKSDIENHWLENLNKETSGKASKIIYTYLWNKCYKAEVLKNVAKTLKACSKTTLGEDVIFTHLLLKECNSCKTVSAPNSYILDTRKSESDRCLYSYKDSLHNKLRFIKTFIKESLFISKDVLKYGISASYRQFTFRRNRRNASRDLYRELPSIEERIRPFLSKWLNQTTDFSNCPIGRNVFVFWWTGFEKAPKVVKSCLASVKQNFPNENVICIDKNNFKEYTDIDPTIIDGFEKGFISIQTFSDILRFNLLKNNGGLWIDATIYFRTPFNILDNLKDKPIESLSFISTEQFLNYKGIYCSWSIFFFASRKNSVFVSAVDDIYKNYFLKYRTFPIYFFTDAILMICKIYGLDGNALQNILTSEFDVFFLTRNLLNEYTKSAEFLIKAVPQKLSRSINSSAENSFYDALICSR